MSITLELQPEIEKGLRAQAQAKGVSLTDYVQEIVTREVHVSETPGVGGPADAKNLVELFAPLRGLFEDGELDFSRNSSTARPVDLT
jgi:hypothetical protein